MRVFVGIGIAVLACALLLATGAQAQTSDGDVSPVPVVPPYCYLAEYDLNFDGKVDTADLTVWKTLWMRSMDSCPFGAPVADCAPGLDINKDGFITFEDYGVIMQFYRMCISNPARAIVLP
jgi:hypothetical protein